MDPHPLVAFSLRLPSRMAAYLGDEAAASDSEHVQLQQGQMVINILSAAQASSAVVFSRPDLHPHPFSPSSKSGVDYRLNRDGIPVLSESLGAISCRLVAPPIPLHNLESFTKQAKLDVGIGKEESARNKDAAVGGVLSELFIARVVDVEMDTGNQGTDEKTPLLYYRRGYTTCRLDHTENQ
ncbi:hypothetical protein V5O48_002512 [Marasmius crinis-equi]|uniref:Flavin reductase like domain-containing protein n=1 Tax=Marasmius crinis-equi TaxID=585013 RepID=A0ABR3FVI3_9AGAR